MQIPCHYESRPFPFYKTEAHSTSRLQDISEVDVGSLSLSSHTSIGRLDSIGRTVLLVSDLVLPPHLAESAIVESSDDDVTYVEPKETVADGLEDVTSHHAVSSSVVSGSLFSESSHGADWWISSIFGEFPRKVKLTNVTNTVGDEDT